MIERDRSPPSAVAVEGLLREIFSALVFVVIVRVTAAGQANAHVRVRAEQPDESDFRVQINRRQRQAQGDIGGDRSSARSGNSSRRRRRVKRALGQALRAAELNQFAQFRINLSKGGGGHARNRQCEPRPAMLIHLTRLHQLPNGRKRGVEKRQGRGI